MELHDIYLTYRSDKFGVAVVRMTQNMRKRCCYEATKENFGTNAGTRYDLFSFISRRKSGRCPSDDYMGHMVYV